MIKAFHHIAIILSSEEHLKFYERLGFRESFRKRREYDAIVLLEGYGLQLEVFIDSRHPKRESGLLEPLGVRHFALKVDEIEKTIAGLGLAKSDVGPVMQDWVGERFCFIKDPDGNVIELHE